MYFWIIQEFKLVFGDDNWTTKDTVDFGATRRALADKAERAERVR